MNKTKSMKTVNEYFNDLFLSAKLAPDFVLASPLY